MAEIDEKRKKYNTCSIGFMQITMNHKDKTVTVLLIDDVCKKILKTVPIGFDEWEVLAKIE